MNISLRQLKAFVAVAQHQGFTPAARDLHLTQSAVSMLVQQLEQEMGLPLFDRAHRRVSLTDTGQQLLPLALQMLHNLSRIVEGAVDLRSLRRGRLRLALPQLLACTWMPERLARFSQSHPGVELQLLDTTADEVVGFVRRGEVDIGIGPERPLDDTIEAEFLRQVPICLVVPRGHGLARRRRVKWAQAQGERWIIYSGGFHRALERALAQHTPGLSLQGASRVGFLTTALSLVGQGQGVTAAPDYARAMAEHFGVSFVELAEPSVNRSFHVYRRRAETLPPAADAFIAMLRAEP